MNAKTFLFGRREESRDHKKGEGLCSKEEELRKAEVAQD